MVFFLSFNGIIRNIHPVTLIWRYIYIYKTLQNYCGIDHTNWAMLKAPHRENRKDITALFGQYIILF